MLNEQLVNKWQPVLEHSDLPEIKDSYRKLVTAHMLEQQENALREEANIVGNQTLLGEAVPATSTANMTGFDPVLISLVRRTAPQLIAFDIMGTQPMSGPSGLVFALRPQYNKTQSAVATGFANAFVHEANTGFSSGSQNASPSENYGIGANTTFHNSPAATFAAATGAATATVEGWGDSTGFPDMKFNIDKVTVTAVSRALKAEYSTELAQDLKAIHGLDAETELANILTTEINAEINRELVRTVYQACKKVTPVSAKNTSTIVGTDMLDGRWLIERFKALRYKIEQEANAIARDTRRGKGNIVICSSDVASALATAGVLEPAAALKVDDAGGTFAGTVGTMKVFIDPYSVTGTGDFAVVGYKGSSPYDAGIFYCPYVPLQMVRAVGENTFQPKIGFKTRYGVVANPFATTAGDGVATGENKYYRGFAIESIGVANTAA